MKRYVKQIKYIFVKYLYLIYKLQIMFYNRKSCKSWLKNEYLLSNFKSDCTRATKKSSYEKELVGNDCAHYVEL